MMMFVLYDTKYQLDIANIIRWHGHVLRREDGYALRAQDFDIEG